MRSMTVKSKRLELPDEVARKLKGKRVAFVETGEGFLLKTVEDPVDAAFGALKGCALTTEEFMRRKQEEKELE
jgi:hypothetical protein